MDNQKHFRLIVPAFLAVGLFILFIFFFIVPEFKDSIMDRKKEMIQQLTNSAWSILDKYNKEIKEKGYEPGQARALAKKDIRFLLAINPKIFSIRIYYKVKNTKSIDSRNQKVI